MYVYERDAEHPGGRVAFIATVPEADNEIGNATMWTGDILRDDVSFDGRYVLFRSRGDLTADDTSSTKAPQLFRYDADTGQLIRISVGEAGFNDDGNENLGNVMYPAPDAGELPARANPAMSSDGSYVFFESPTALTPGALNNVRIGEEIASGEPAYAYNIYEWHEGHVYLLSDGRDVSGSKAKPCEEHLSSVCLLGTDASAKDVFFTTADSLVAGDEDTQMDVYDARVCTTLEPCIHSASTTAPCQGEACHGPASEALAAGTPASLTFTGLGNARPTTTTPAKPPSAAQLRARKLAAALKQCRKKHPGRKRRTCEAQARRKYDRASKSTRRGA